MAFPLFAPRRAPGELGLDGGSPPANTRAPTVLGRGAGVYGPGREIAALLFWTCAVFLILALASYAGDPGTVQAPIGAPGGDGVGPLVGDVPPPSVSGANWVG